MLRALMAIPLLLAVPAATAAQGDPVPPPPADRSALHGVVMDEEGAPVENVEIVILGRREAARTDAAGVFRLDNIPPGVYDLMIRRLGYVSVGFEWPARGGVRVDVAVSLRPLPVTLDPVVISERENRALTGTSTIRGVIVDSSGRRVPDVEVQLVGSGRRTITGHDGAFTFRRVSSGEYTVSSRRLGYTAVSRSLRMMDGEEREVVFVMNQLPQMLDAVEIRERSGFGRRADALRDLDMRLRWFGGTTNVVILGPDVLSQYNKISLETLVDFRGRLSDQMRGGRAPTSILPSGGSTTVRRDSPEADECILLDGVTFVEQPLRSFSSDQVERIEYYPRNSEITGTVGWRMKGRCAPTTVGHPPYYVLWMKRAS